MTRTYCDMCERVVFLMQCCSHCNPSHRIRIRCFDHSHYNSVKTKVTYTNSTDKKHRINIKISKTRPWVWVLDAQCGPHSCLFGCDMVSCCLPIWHGFNHCMGPLWATGLSNPIVSCIHQPVQGKVNLLVIAW